MRLQFCVEALLTEQRLLLQEIRLQSTLISSLQNTHRRSNTLSQKSHSPDIREQLRRALGRFGSQTTVRPCDARGCQCAQPMPSSSLVQMASGWNPAPSGLSDDDSPRGHGLTQALDEAPVSPQVRLEGQQEDVPASSCCRLM